MGDILTARVTVPADVLFRDLDGESVILNLQTESYFGLDEVGTRMWALLTASDTVQAALDALLEEYETDAGTLRKDLEELIGKLADQGLLEVSRG
jgi:hypothetical protein